MPWRYIEAVLKARKTPRSIVRNRLREVVASDREAASDGAWRMRLPMRVEWGKAGVQRPVYRWQVRR